MRKIIVNRTAIIPLLASVSLAGITGLAVPARSQTQTSAPAGTDAAAPAPTAVDTSDLNPAFFLTPAQVERAIRNGRDMAQKKWIDHDFMAKNGKNPVSIQGQKEIDRNSFVVCDALNGLGISRAVFESATQSKPLQLPPGVDEKSGATAQALDVDILLESDASVTIDGLVLREAQPEGVKATHFTLTDDQGHSFEPMANTVVSDVMHGIKKSRGTYNKVFTSSTSNTALVTIHGSSEVSGITQPWVQSNTYYTASYRVAFPLFGKDGKALFTPATKRVTLHIQTDLGERTVEFDLKPPKK